MIRVVILGSGHLAHHLYRVFNGNHEVDIIQCYNRKGIQLDTKQHPDSITNDLKKIATADVYILAVSDKAIETLSSELELKNKLVVHTSGNTPMHVIDKKHRIGVFYPLQSFNKEKEINFENIPICIEANQQEDLNLLDTLASSISSKVYQINTNQRKTLHIAAVFANNFVNHLFTLSKKLCDESNIPFEILTPLIDETINKIQHIEPLKAQTGPAIRNDINTIENHLEILNKKILSKKIYKILTESIQNTYGKEL